MGGPSGHGQRNKVSAAAPPNAEGGELGVARAQCSCCFAVPAPVPRRHTRLDALQASAPARNSVWARK